MTRFTLNPIFDSYTLVALIAVALFALLFIRPPIEPRRRRILASLRIISILLLLVVMLRPTIIRMEEVPQAATLMILTDTSRSMTVPDASGGDKERYAAMREALDESAESIAELGDRFEVKAFSFSDTFNELEIEDGHIRLPSKPDGNETAIGHALTEAIQREAGKRLLGIIMLSDGAQRAYPPLDTPPQTAANRLKYLGCPLFTVPFGQTQGLGQARDVAVTDLLTSKFVFVKNRLDVGAKVRVNGYANRNIPVRLLFESLPEPGASSGKMQVVEQKMIHATKPNELIPIELSYVPQKPGQFKVTIDVPEQAGELVTTNNSQSTFVTVLPGGLNVLYIEGALRREVGSLRSALDASPDIEVDYIHLSKLSRPGSLLDRFKPGKYKVYILGDVDSTAFTKEELTALARAVDDGAGLLLLGGFQAFGAGGYGDTPLADISPIVMNRLDRQTPGSPIRKDLHLSGRLRMRPTEIGNRHFLMTLSKNPEANQRIWAELPALEGANKFTKLKRGAAILAEDQNENPLLVVQSAGAGRVVAFAGDTTWHWPMKGFDEIHKRFWRQMILWLSRQPDVTERGRVWVKLEQAHVWPGSSLKFTTGAQTLNGDPLPDVRIDAELLLPDGSTRELTTQRIKDHRIGTFEVPQMKGDYTIQVTATQEGSTFGTAKECFSVEDLELDNPAADISGLESLATTTDGRMVIAEDLPALLKELLEQTDELVTTTEVHRTLWDNGWILLLITTLFTLEWFLRKRWGQV